LLHLSGALPGAQPTAACFRLQYFLLCHCDVKWTVFLEPCDGDVARTSVWLLNRAVPLGDANCLGVGLIAEPCFHARRVA
jgi:hypothetical protein